MQTCRWQVLLTYAADEAAMGEHFAELTRADGYEVTYRGTCAWATPSNSLRDWSQSCR